MWHNHKYGTPVWDILLWLFIVVCVLCLSVKAHAVLPGQSPLAAIPSYRNSVMTSVPSQAECPYVEPPPITDPDSPLLEHRPILFIPMTLKDMAKVVPTGRTVCGYTAASPGVIALLAARMAGNASQSLADRIFHFLRDNPDGCVIVAPDASTEPWIAVHILLDIKIHEVIGHCYLRLMHGPDGRGWFTQDGRVYKLN